MQIAPITDKNTWETFFQNVKRKTFLNSWNWGNFYNSLGNKIWRFGIFQEKDLIGTFLVIKKEATRGNHLFIPYGPTLKEDILLPKDLIIDLVKKEMSTLALSENCFYLKIAPAWDDTKENRELLERRGFWQAPMFVHPEITWILDISKDLDKIFAQMRKTTRYMIRQAQKAEVEIIKSTDPSDIKKYNELYLSTVARHDFVPFSEEYLEKELKAFAPDAQALIFFAKYQNKIISGAIVIFWQGVAYYHQGASDNTLYSKIGASYLLQYAIIKEAKARNCQSYNFWGIVPGIKSEDDLNNPVIKTHPWYGLSLFKMGFGGKIVNYLPTYNLPVKIVSYFSFIYEAFERFKKRL